MNSTIELKTPKKEGSFSQKQTTLILENFFSDNPVNSFNIKRNGKFPDGSQFFLGEMTSSKGKSFRVYFVCKETSGKWLIHILKFENN
jgi:hypothetical protein